MDKSTSEFLDKVREITESRGEDPAIIEVMIDSNWEYVISMMHTGFTPEDVADYLC